MDRSGGELRHVSYRLPVIVLDHVRRRAGDEAVHEVLRAAAEARPAAALLDGTARVSTQEFRRLLEAAASRLGGVDSLREIAHPETVAERGTNGTADAIRSLGGPGPVLRHLSADDPTLHDLVDVRFDELGRGEWHVEARVLPGEEPYPELCAFLIAVVELIPTTFDEVVEPVVEESCQCRGDRSCSFTLRWGTGADAAQEARFEARLRELDRRHRAFRDAVGDVVLAEDLDAAMTHLVRAAATETDATTVVLALAPLPGLARLVFSVGADEDEAAAIAATLLAPNRVKVRGALVVDVVSHQHRYGRMAVFIGDRLTLDGRDVVSSYAQLAATGLDTATALESARREATRAHALLELAATLAECTSVEQLGRSLTAATPAVVGADRAVFSIEDRTTGTYEIVATYGFPTSYAGRHGRVGINHESFMNDIALYRPGHASTEMEQLFSSLGSAAAVVIPVVVDGEREGWLYADVTDDPERLAAGPELTARLVGLAAQASSALRNARLLERIRHQAFHDALTGLPNRTLILDRAEHMLARARREDLPVGALFIDLDGFKEINDTLGHAAGDQFLQSVAHRLSATIRESDTLARLGGDEFVVLVEGCTDEGDAEVLAARLLDVLAEPFRLEAVEGPPVLVTASIGVATGVRPSAAELLRDADIALYRAKARGKNRCVVFSAEAEAAVRDRTRVETDLCRAVENEEFFLLYDPVIDDDTELLQGVRAVLQWQHPEHGPVPASTFSEPLLHTGLVVPVGRWTLQEACRQLAAWDPMWRVTGAHPYVAVEIAVRHLLDKTLIGDVEAALGSSGLQPSQLVIVVGAASVVDDLASASDQVRQLAALGVRVTIDPFLARALAVEVTDEHRDLVQGASEPLTPDALVERFTGAGLTASRR